MLARGPAIIVRLLGLGKPSQAVAFAQRRSVFGSLLRFPLAFPALLAERTQAFGLRRIDSRVSLLPGFVVAPTKRRLDGRPRRGRAREEVEGHSDDPML